MIALLINDGKLLQEISTIENNIEENEDYPNMDYKIVKKASTDDLWNGSKTIFYFGEDINDLEV